MLDIQFIRENHQIVRDTVVNKNKSVDIDRLLEVDEKRRQLMQEVEKLRKARNETSAQMKNGVPAPELIAEGKRIKESLSEIESELDPTDIEFEELMLKVPNIPLEEVPIGKSEDENVIIGKSGEPTKFTFDPKNHWEIAQQHDWIDKERAAKVAGSRFAYLKGGLVQLQFGIVQYVINRLTDEDFLKDVIKQAGLTISSKPFVPVIPPMIVNTVAYKASARLDAEKVTYKLADDEMWLNASAEHSLCNMYMNEVLEENDLPIRYIGYATSFRREAGTYGKDTEGIFRTHQFDKLEMESFTTPATGLEEHHLMVAIQKRFMDELKIPYQVLEKCTADIGFPNAKGVDIEAWLPGQDKYIETHSADYMADFQARRLKTRVKIGHETHFVHTNDATALVLSRIPVAIIENFQTKDGDVVIPKVLRPFMGEREKI